MHEAHLLAQPNFNPPPLPLHVAGRPFAPFSRLGALGSPWNGDA